MEGRQKLLVGNLGAMEKMLDLIRNKLSSGTYSVKIHDNEKSSSLKNVYFQKRVMMFWNMPGRPCGMSLMKRQSTAGGSWMGAV